MAEELQNLLERIQKDGVEKAEGEAAKIASDAKEKADKIVSDAKDDAAQAMKKAEQDAEAFTERSKKSLEQAARDVILSVEQAVANTLKSIVSQEVSQALSNDTIKKMLSTLVESYFTKKDDKSKVDILLNADQQKDVTDFFMAKYADIMKKGVEVKADDSIVAGFRVSVKNEKVEHDFSQEAITDALCQLLRPHLGEIVKKASS